MWCYQNNWDVGSWANSLTLKDSPVGKAVGVTPWRPVQLFSPLRGHAAAGCLQGIAMEVKEAVASLGFMHLIMEYWSE